MEERLGQVHLLILGFCDTETCLPRCSAIRANMTSHVKRFPQYMKGTVSGCAFTDSRDLQTDSLSYFFFSLPSPIVQINANTNHFQNRFH